MTGTMTGTWRHLFVDGEYVQREKLLAGLSLEQVTCRPSEQSHSIFEELWHAAEWQRIVVSRDQERYKASLNSDLYPKNQPVSEREWRDLVGQFLSGLEDALAWTDSPEKLQLESNSGVTMADDLLSLAVHNAYHLGKIVALRQMIGSWPP